MRLLKASRLRRVAAKLSLAWLAVAGALSGAPATGLLHVSYDVTREFYAEYNAAFAAHQKALGEAPATVKQSHGGSSAQIRSVLGGLQADVVSMNQEIDIDRLVDDGLVAKGWQGRLPHRSVPYTSTILFVVRHGNPKGIHDWNDLIRDDVSIVVPNPKTSGNGRYSYLAAWGYALRSPGGSPASARAFVAKLFARVAVLDAGGRGASTTFAQNGVGDVLLTFENEVALLKRQFPTAGLEVVVPKESIRADNPVVWVDRTVEARGTAGLAKDYLGYLFSPEGQELAAKHHFRPIDPAVAAAHAGDFPSLSLFSVEEVAGSWRDAQATHFDDGGIFDQISAK